MAQPPATAKRVKTEETNWPLRPHVQEQRQNVVHQFVSFCSYDTADVRNLNFGSFVASVPFDVKAIEVDVIAGPDNSTTSRAPMLIGIPQLDAFFGTTLHAVVPGVGGSKLAPTRHEFARPFPMQGMQLSLRLTSPSTTSGFLGIGSTIPYTTAGSVPPGVMRLSYYRNTK